ncbi:Hypothetical predicted protein [Octopus vulgaris]|uniref:Uncharacterized protein n=1 Tax=Octopus vulgaris TaxID=6645 RepID=A0AA36F6X3_OCTVU|nr:Hypothetical predicted protein [Octopus vulgaris]
MHTCNSRTAYRGIAVLSREKSPSRWSDVLDADEMIPTKELKVMARWISNFEKVYKMDPPSTALNTVMSSTLVTDLPVSCNRSSHGGKSAEWWKGTGR